MSEKRPSARPLAIPAVGHYTIEEALEFQDLLPPLEGGAMRIRLRVGRATILDLLLPDNSLTALSHFLIPKFPPAGWQREDKRP